MKLADLVKVKAHKVLGIDASTNFNRIVIGNC